MKKNGQSTIEFILTLTFLFGFIFIYAQIAFNYTNGYLLHYATYMASRAYLVTDTNSNQVIDGPAQAQAQEVFKKILPTASISLKFNNPDIGLTKSLYTGVYIDFQQLFSLSNVVGGRVPMNLRSESFLGREPSRTECLLRIRAALTELARTDDISKNVTFDDNGC